jgi:voltage-gated sodium channel
MYETMTVYPFSWLFYLTFIFIVAFVFLNMMIGIVLETLQREHAAEQPKGPTEEQVEVIDQRTQAMALRLQRLEKHLMGNASRLDD